MGSSIHSFIHSFSKYVSSAKLWAWERETAAARKQTVGLGASAIRNSGGRGGGRGRVVRAGPREEVTPELRLD